jgi:hypothetical protein
MFKKIALLLVLFTSSFSKAQTIVSDWMSNKKLLEINAIKNFWK